MTLENQNPIQNSMSTTSQEKIKMAKLQANDSYMKKWNVPQNILYARYLKTHMGQMCNKKKKKCGKFVKMASFIGSKTENQCRSHHQKMLLTFKSIQNIINYISEIKTRGELIPLEEYQNKFGIDLTETSENKSINKIEEQISTERQSEQEIREEKTNQNDLSQTFQKGLPVLEEESKMVSQEFGEDRIFDVLNIDAEDLYGQLFSF